MQAIHFPPLRARGTVLRIAAATLVILAGATQARAGEPSNVINVHTLATASGEGANPRGDLLLAPDGNFYGTTSAGGAAGLGSVYKLTPDGTLTTLHSFAGPSEEGSNPYAGLLYAADGNFYGTTYFGGAKQAGTVFRITPAGTFSNLASFNGDSKGAFFPYGGLAQTADGTFYGTTLRGGANDKGTVFKMDATGAVTVIHEFAVSGGANPEGPLVVGADGALYGTTLLGGPNDRGTIFRITTAGTLTTLYSFSTLSPSNAAGVSTNSDGANPRAGLTRGSDGNFYGSAYQGGVAGVGTVFRITPAGAFTVLHAFTGAPDDGANPLAGVTVAPDGTLYGTTEKGGTGKGTAWQITAAGAYRVLHQFTGLPVDGAAPYVKLVPLGGYLYGASYANAESAADFSLGGAGVIFKLDLGTGGVPPVTLSATPHSIATGGSATLSWSAPDAASCIAGGAWADTVGTSGTKALTGTDAGLYTYLLSCTDGAGVVRHAHEHLVVTAPSAQPVDGGAGSGGGAFGGLALLCLGSLGVLTVGRRLLAYS
jgi:uncharacterized repeat protein (TIGR03803 family)